MGKQRTEAFFLIVPAILVLLSIYILPFIYNLRLSFEEWVLTRPYIRKWVGFSNYVSLFQDDVFWSCLRVTSIIVVVSVTISFFVGFLIAYLLSEYLGKRQLIRTFVLIPMMVCPGVIGLFWRAMFNPQIGLANYILRIIGMGALVPEAGFTGDPKWVLWAVAGVDIWQWTPFMILVLLAGMESLSISLFEAAEMDGASSWQKIIYLTFPLLRPIIIIALLIRTIDAFRLFDIVWTMTRGGPGHLTETFSLFIYKVAFQHLNMGYAMAAAVIMLCMAIVIANCYLKFLKEE